LNEKATRIWNLLLQMQGNVEQTEHALEDSHLRCQLASLKKDCLERGFLSLCRSGRPRPVRTKLLNTNPRFFLGLRAWWSLFYTAYALRVKGFSRTYREYAELPPNAAPHPETLLHAAQRAFLRAENLFWYRRAPEDCLPRSLALFRFLRITGVPVMHVIGGRRFPAFLMHAWVEHGGSAVLDDAVRVREYTHLACMPHE
jgi:hypothetical protein